MSASERLQLVFDIHKKLAFWGRKLPDTSRERHESVGKILGANRPLFTPHWGEFMKGATQQRVRRSSCMFSVLRAGFCFWFYRFVLQIKWSTISVPTPVPKKLQSAPPKLPTGLFIVSAMNQVINYRRRASLELFWAISTSSVLAGWNNAKITDILYTD